jgi:acyl-CoA synthetase (AMP-forming)/AMP-acid ligase II
VLVGNRAEWFDLTFGLLKAGLVRVYINPRLAVPEISHLLRDSGARAFVVSQEYRESALASDLADVDVLVTSDDEYSALVDEGVDDPICAELDGAALAALWYSSGTTGRPKGVMQTHAMWRSIIATMVADVGIDRDDVLLHVGPMSHASGSFAYPILARGGTNVVFSGFDVAALVQAIPVHRVTTLMLVPTMIYDLLDLVEGRGIDSSSLRRILYGAAPMSPARLGRCLDVLGPIFSQMYGQAECPMISALPPSDHRPGATVLESAGLPLTGTRLRILGDTGRDLPPGEVGEVVVSSPLVMPGYWNLPERTAEIKDADGWLRTGDVGRLDEAGYLYIVDRKNDMIVSGGYNVYPNEVELALLRHPAVAEAAVVGVPDDRWGEAVTAVVRLRDGLAAAGEDELRDWCRGHLADYKVPKRIVPHPEPLPRNAAGKLLRRVLREPYWADRERHVG